MDDISEAETSNFKCSYAGMKDAGLSTYAAKIHYNLNAFMINKVKTCTHREEEVLGKFGSFPSGHTHGVELGLWFLVKFSW